MANEIAVQTAAGSLIRQTTEEETLQIVYGARDEHLLHGYRKQFTRSFSTLLERYFGAGKDKYYLRLEQWQVLAKLIYKKAERTRRIGGVFCAIVPIIGWIGWGLLQGDNGAIAYVWQYRELKRLCGEDFLKSAEVQSALRNAGFKIKPAAALVEDMKEEAETDAKNSA